MLSRLFKWNWKTSWAGIIACGSAIEGIAHSVVNHQDVSAASIAAFVAGLGLIFAKDSNVTGGNTKQPANPQP